MGKKQTQHVAFRLEDYNQPTQPMEQIFLPPTSPGYRAAGWSPDALTVSPTERDIQPFPQVGAPAYPFYQSPASPVYPVLPAAPYQKARGYPPGGVPFAGQPQQTRRRRSPIPLLVRLLFLGIQAILIAKFVFMILGTSVSSLWLYLLFGASDLFVWPVRLLVANINTSVLTGTELLIYLELLLALLVYGLFSLLLVRSLRALL